MIPQGAWTLPAQAVEAEVAAWIDQHAHLTVEQGRRQVVRNGYAHPRKIITGVGPEEVTRPRVHDRRPPEDREAFTSTILSPYLRKAKAVEELIPWLYLKGVSTGDVFARYLVRLEEMRQSVHIIEQLIDHIPSGPMNTFADGKMAKPPRARCTAASRA